MLKHLVTTGLRFARTPVRFVIPQSRAFSGTRNKLGSSFLNLAGLSASRESQHLAKEYGRPRTEYSSSLDLIRSSEVDPFAPAPGASPLARKRTKSSDATDSALVASQLVIARLTAELQDSRQESVKLTDAILHLHGKYRSAERLSTTLLLLSIILITVIFRPDLLDDLSPRFNVKEVSNFLRHWEDRCHWMFAGGIGLPQRGIASTVKEHDQKAIDVGTSPRNYDRDASQHTRPTRQQRPLWRRIIWASPESD